MTKIKKLGRLSLAPYEEQRTCDALKRTKFLPYFVLKHFLKFKAFAPLSFYNRTFKILSKTTKKPVLEKKVEKFSTFESFFKFFLIKNQNKI